MVLPLLLATLAAYYPTQGWREATPESQGLDSAVLAEAVDYARDKKLPLHSLLVVRHGYVVLDAYFYPYQPGVPHDVASVTKSVTSALIGIALNDARQPILPLLGAPPDPRKDHITLADLLTMTSGLDCGISPGEPELMRMLRSPDWIAFALGLPMRYDPGMQFAYCSVNHHLLSAILTRKTGQSALAFARQRLFSPLGIAESRWPPDPKGFSHGWGDLHLLPRDMAKIGYLYLHDGAWDGRQVVPREWVRDSVRPHSAPGRPGAAYGYSWWLHPENQPPYFEALGRGGQRITVVPEKDVVLVFTAGGADPGELAPYLWRAIRADGPLPANEAALARLKKSIAAAEQPPAAVPPAALPEIAAAVSGKLYRLSANPLDFETLALEFLNPSEARVAFSVMGRQFTVPVSLDGRYRISPGPQQLPAGALGAWRSQTDFHLELNSIADINCFLLDLHFSPGRLEVTLNERTGLFREVHAAGTPQ